MRNWLEVNPSTLVLARGQLASFRIDGRACRISCVAGRLWVTETGQLEDSVLTPGQKVTFTRRGRIVVEALRTATVRIEVPPAGGGKAATLLTRGRLPARFVHGGT